MAIRRARRGQGGEEMSHKARRLQRDVGVLKVPWSTPCGGFQRGWHGGIFRHFSDHSYILRSPCSTYGTSTTQWTGSISVAFPGYRRTLPLDIEFPQKPALWILTAPKPRSVLVSSTVAFCHLGILLAVSGECIRRCYIEHLTSHHVCSFGPTATSGH